ncbi:MAG: type IX secretion system sortase PorU [Flavobacteriales bacterium]|nr:type IX secretion system sortase PorU [Flavobacteriales bacterium]
MMNRIVIVVGILVFCNILNAKTLQKSLKLDWQIQNAYPTENKKISYLYFDGAEIRPKGDEFHPFYRTRIPVSSQNISNFTLNIKNATYENLSAQELSLATGLASTIEIKHFVVQHRKRSFIEVEFIPLSNAGKLISCDLEIQFEEVGAPKDGDRAFAATSILSSGDWYKIAVTESGLHQITGAQLSEIGIDISLINPDNIRIYGNGPKVLPIKNDEQRFDDLYENAILVDAGNDLSFDLDDYILFYGEGIGYWNYDTLNNDFNHAINIYSDSNFYFLNFDLGPGKRITAASTPGTSSQTVSDFFDYQFHEIDQVNLLKSGRQWFGEIFDVKTAYSYTFNFPNLQNNELDIKVAVAGRTISTSSSFTAEVDGQQSSVTINSVPSDYTAQFARNAFVNFSPTSSSDLVNMTLTFNKGNSSAIGWLDYIEVKGKRRLKIENAQLIFQNPEVIGNGDATYTIESNVSLPTQIWDITFPQDIKSIPFSTNGNNFEFNYSTDSIHRFIVSNGSNFKSVNSIKSISNQNLHATNNVELVIIAPSEFRAEADEMAQIHIDDDGLSAVVVDLAELYNEFSGGKKDITAIKDFMKMMYDRAATPGNVMPRYLCLFGDGSYDIRGRISNQGNIIPTYQTANSLLPTSFTSGSSYVSDDYFGLLDDSESESINDIVDIGIGRLPVKNKVEAANMIQKIRNYYDRETMNSWRNIVSFVGDDEDGNIHMSDANALSGTLANVSNEYNIEKIFLDAYQQQSSSGGERYPGVKDDINNRMAKGALVMSYTGHGGELGWAHERILEIPDINSWDNTMNMPIMITATCEFSRFDDPLRISAGELTLLNPSGGNIGLLTTTRLVFSSPNFDIAKAFFQNLNIPMSNGEMPRFGDLSRITKFYGPKKDNTRNFTLLGDPAIRLAYPRYNVITTTVPDTVKALSKVTISGYVANDANVKIHDFNGVIYPVVYDKPSTVKTLNNDGNGTYTFKTQKNIIFKGKASVVNGEFTFSFVVPKDISYEYGYGKISYYAEDNLVDANGYYDTLVVGGFDSTAVLDETGPEVRLYMNDDNFVFGGVTDENPDIYAIIFDENGINTVGNGIGHDITATLDNKTSDVIVLNDVYESDLDSYQSGTVRYPLKDLEEGKHTLNLKVWDVHNNSSDAYTEFIVAKSEEFAVEHVLNYPNPFTTNTSFYFEHNFPGQDLDVTIQIFTVSGKLVKSMNLDVNSDGYRAGPFDWNGKDEFGDKIGKGVYIYKVYVHAPNGQKVEKYERLVILG